MEILDGASAGLAEALRLVNADPNPEHLREARLILGRNPSIHDLTSLSLAASAFAFYGVDGTAAVLGGVASPGCRPESDRQPGGQVWYTATATTMERHRWLWRQSLRHMDQVRRTLGPGALIWQEIPAEYARGLNFVRHLGFRETGRARSAITGAELVRVEWEIPRDDA